MIMEYNVVRKLEVSWGNKLCDHPRLEKEYYAGAFLVSYVCVQCGKEFTIPQKLEMDEIIKKSTRNKVKS
jgi:Fe2+ or Zn2+ uptake regulation protein